jgi:hypothetical protein
LAPGFKAQEAEGALGEAFLQDQKNNLFWEFEQTRDHFWLVVSNALL